MCKIALGVFLIDLACIHESLTYSRYDFYNSDEWCYLTGVTKYVGFSLTREPVLVVVISTLKWFPDEFLS